MAVPVQQLLFSAFQGEEEGINTTILPDIFSPGGCRNLYIDKLGRAKKILGYVQYNSTTVTTNTGGSTCLLRSIQPFKSIIAGTTVRNQIGVFDDGVDEWEIWTSADDGLTWTFRVDAGASSVGKIADFAQFGNILYITNGVFAPKKWTTSIAVAGRTQSPTPAYAAGIAGVLKGTYKWKLVSVFNDGTRKAGSVATAAAEVNATKATITWTADADGTVVGYELYRTTSTGAIFYFVDYIDLKATATYTDNIADITIIENRVMEEHGDPPPVGAYFCEAHKSRMWWGRTDTNPTRVYWSDNGLPEDVYSSNFMDFSDGETVGDVITGMFGNIDGKLVVFTEKSVWTVSGTGTVIGNVNDWNRVRSNAGIGAVNHRVVVRVPAGAKWPDQEGNMQTTSTTTLAYLSPYHDIRLFDGLYDQIFSHPKQDLLSTLNYAQRAKAIAFHDPTRGEIGWSFPTSTSENDTTIIWNYWWGVWYEREWAFSCIAQADTTAVASFLIAGSTTAGNDYILWSGQTFAGANFTSTWMTKTIYGYQAYPYHNLPEIGNTKRWRWADILFDVDQPVVLFVEWFHKNATDASISVGNVTISTSPTGVLTVDLVPILTSSGDAINTPNLSQGTRRVILKDTNGAYTYDEGFVMRITDTVGVGQWAIEGLNIAYQSMPGLQRHMQDPLT